MRERTGEVFRIAEDNAPLDGLTVSRKVGNGIYCFSLGRNTDISGEEYRERKLLISLSGSFSLTSSSAQYEVKPGEAVITEAPSLFGIKTVEESVYMEVELGRKTMVSDRVKDGEVFSLKDLVPYRDDSIVNLDVVSSDDMKFVVMAFDGGTALSPHAAPGDAVIFALEGEGIITYEGKEHTLHEGENFRFRKGGMHAVKADRRFKMALLLTLA